MKIYFHDQVPDRIKQLATQNHWILQEDLSKPPDEGFLLLQDEQARLSIRDLSEPAWNPLCIDFLEPQFLLRLKKVEHETQLIKRAIGFKPQDDILIWDATAGLGRDAIVMIQLGYKVVATERSLILFELLFDAVSRASESEEFRESLKRLKLIYGDSRALLSNLKGDEKPDVIYLDPMYPATKKSAQPKKEMQILRRLLGPDDNLQELIEVARSIANKKVILKNSPRAEFSLKPKHSLESKSVRFDVF